MERKPVLWVVVPCYNEEAVLPVTAPLFAQKLGELNKSLSDGGGKQTRSIGLLNVNKRLKLLYGSDYGITVDSRENVFTRVSIKFKNDLRGIGE